MTLEVRRAAARCAGPSARNAVKSEGEIICITNPVSCCTRGVQGRITQLEDFQQSACQFVETDGVVRKKETERLLFGPQTTEDLIGELGGPLS